MDIQLNRESNFLTKNLKSLVLPKLFTTIVISTVGFVIILAVLYIFYHQFTFYGDDTVYMLAQELKRYLPCVFIIIWLIDVIYVISFYWKKSLGYTEVMIHASKQLIADDGKLISFPIELKEVEEQMNQVKMNAVRNAQIAREAEQRKNDLIVYLAHDLKTPLTSVIGYLTLLNDEQQISNELREKYLSISLNKAERLEELINEFFEITRFNLSQLNLDISKINLTRMLQQISYEFKPMFETKNLKCDLKAETDIEIKCDVNKMERVFDNLIRNAIHYCFENSTIEITAEQKKNGVYIRFSNEGNTIPEEKLNRIFEQFYRLDSSRDTKTGGSGLGLAIAKKIIELHNGTINVHSENEKIHFKIYIPTLS